MTLVVQSSSFAELFPHMLSCTGPKIEPIASPTIGPKIGPKTPALRFTCGGRYHANVHPEKTEGNLGPIWDREGSNVFQACIFAETVGRAEDVKLSEIESLIVGTMPDSRGNARKFGARLRHFGAMLRYFWAMLRISRQCQVFLARGRDQGRGQGRARAGPGPGPGRG